MCGQYLALLHELDAEIRQLVPSGLEGFYVSQVGLLVDTPLLASPAAKTIPDKRGETNHVNLHLPWLSIGLFAIRNDASLIRLNDYCISRSIPVFSQRIPSIHKTGVGKTTVSDHLSIGLKKFSRGQAQLSVLPPFSSTVCTFTCIPEVSQSPVFGAQQSQIASL